MVGLKKKPESRRKNILGKWGGGGVESSGMLPAIFIMLVARNRQAVTYVIRLDQVYAKVLYDV